MGTLGDIDGGGRAWGKIGISGISILSLCNTNATLSVCWLRM